MDKYSLARCQAAESLTQGGADAEVGPVTASGQGAQHAERSGCTTSIMELAGCTLGELMLSLGSMSGNLLGGDTLAGRGAGSAGVRVRGARMTRKANLTYPYHFFLRETILSSPRFNLHWLVSPFRLLVLGWTYCTYLHYGRTYTTNVPTL